MPRVGAALPGVIDRASEVTFPELICGCDCHQACAAASALFGGKHARYQAGQDALFIVERCTVHIRLEMPHAIAIAG